MLRKVFLSSLGIAVIFTGYAGAAIQNIISTAPSNGSAVNWDSLASWTTILPDTERGLEDIYNVGDTGADVGDPNQKVTISGPLNIIGPTVRYVRMSNGAVLNQNGGSLSTWGGGTVGFRGPNSTYNLNAGTMTSGENDLFVVGWLPGSEGTFNIGAGATFENLAPAGYSPLIIAYSSASKGTINVKAGGTFISPNTVVVGRGGDGVFNCYGTAHIGTVQLGGLGDSKCTFNVYQGGTFTADANFTFDASPSVSLNFLGGEIFIKGNQTATGPNGSIGSKAWFHHCHSYMEVYNSTTDYTRLYYTTPGDCRCGDPGTAQMNSMDFNKDCRVNFKDFAQFSASWLVCTADCN